MTPRDLLESLDRLVPRDDHEAKACDEIRDFVRRSPSPFSRATAEGHVTASAIVASPEGSEFLLLRHRKLDRWLQPGGHLEPQDESVFAAALREAREETGIERFAFPIGEEILDVDVHPIPAHGPDPAHFHYDIRHLFVAQAPGEPVLDGISWFSLPEAVAAGIDDSLCRALRKASGLLFAPVPVTYPLPPTT